MSPTKQKPVAANTCCVVKGYEISPKNHKLVFPNSYCMVEGMANWDWDRSEKRHYPEIHNRNKISLTDPPLLPRDLMIDTARRREKRHYCLNTYYSYLDDFY